MNAGVWATLVYLAAMPIAFVIGAVTTKGWSERGVTVFLCMVFWPCGALLGAFVLLVKGLEKAANLIAPPEQ